MVTSFPLFGQPLSYRQTVISPFVPFSLTGHLGVSGLPGDPLRIPFTRTPPPTSLYGFESQNLFRSKKDLFRWSASYFPFNLFFLKRAIFNVFFPSIFFFLISPRLGSPLTSHQIEGLLPSLFTFFFLPLNQNIIRQSSLTAGSRRVHWRYKYFGSPLFP